MCGLFSHIGVYICVSHCLCPCVVVHSPSHVHLFETPWTVACQASLSFTGSQNLLNSCLLNQWCHPTISPSVAPFSCCLQSFLASGSVLMSQLFISGGQSTGALASASVLPMNIQGWFPLGLTGLISLQSEGLSRVFSSTTIWKHQFFGTQCFLWPKSIHLLSITLVLGESKTRVMEPLPSLVSWLVVLGSLPKSIDATGWELRSKSPSRDVMEEHSVPGCPWSWPVSMMETCRVSLVGTDFSRMA